MKRWTARRMGELTPLRPTGEVGKRSILAAKTEAGARSILAGVFGADWAYGTEEYPPHFSVERVNLEDVIEEAGVEWWIDEDGCHPRLKLIPEGGI